MGIVKLSNIRSYWSQSNLFGIQGFRQIMSRDTYFFIKRYLQIYDPHQSYENEVSTFYKVRYIIDTLLNNSRRIYFPTGALSLDEAMIKYDGRHKDK